MNDQQPHSRRLPQLILAGLLLIWQPFSLAMTMSGLLDQLSARGTGLALILLIRLVAAGLGIAAGLAIFRRQSGAVTIAKASLVFSALVDIVVYATPYSPNNRPPGDATIILVASLLYYAGWFIYLTRASSRESL
jgi:chromate transport protein ChrA